MSDPPAAITNPETSNTASQSRPCEHAAQLVDVGAVGHQPLDVVGQIRRRPPPVEHGDVVSAREQRLDGVLADEHRATEDERPHEVVPASWPGSDATDRRASHHGSPIGSKRSW